MRKWRVLQTRENLGSRPQRFPACAPVRYRLANEMEWRPGTIENFSSSGMKFRVKGLDGVLERDTPLELSFTVPREIGGDGKTQVFSRAYTKRILPPSEPDASPAVAVAITDYVMRVEQWD